MRLNAHHTRLTALIGVAYTALSLGRRVSGGYEMRWWMPNGDDVVVDGFIFPSAKVAHTYFE